MKNFVQQGCTITVPAPTNGAVSGSAYLIGAALFGVAAFSAGAGHPVELVTEGVYDLPKSAVAFAAGDKAFWDSTNAVISATASGNAWVGVVVTPAIASASTARVRLNQHPII